MSKPEYITPNYVEYERQKKMLPDNLSQSEYERRVREIAQKCGV